jgi:hypothetical protein
MNNQTVLVEKKWYQSSNFWTWIVLLIGSLIVNFSEIQGAATDMVSQIFALIAGGKMLHNFQKKGVGWDISQIGGSNFWGYLALIATQITSIAIPDQLWTDLQQIAENLLLGNWQGAIGAVFSAIVIIANLVKTGKAAKT